MGEDQNTGANREYPISEFVDIVVSRVMEAHPDYEHVVVERRAKRLVYGTAGAVELLEQPIIITGNVDAAANAVSDMYNSPAQDVLDEAIDSFCTELPI